MLPAVMMAQGTPRHLIVTPHFYASSGTHLRRMAQGRGDHIADRQVLSRAERVLCVSQSEASARLPLRAGRERAGRAQRLGQ